MSNHTNRLLIQVVICIAIAAEGFAEPKWTSQIPKGKNHSYAVGFGESSQSLYEARKGSLAEAINAFSQQSSVKVEARLFTRKHETSSGIEDEALSEILTTNESTTIRGLRIVETYVASESPPYRVWTLVSLPSSGSDISHASAIWRSAVLPGWGQVYQGKTWRGVGLMTVEVGAVATAIFTNIRQQDYERQAAAATTVHNRRYYFDLADQSHQANTIAIGVAVACYALNVADVLFLSDNRADLYYGANFKPTNRAYTLTVCVTLP